ncbi:GGDEF and EAL domain-containing protein [Pyruvatibacter sp.]|uniref:putative bifunctional diguanylate cyclase/phosphodiesterase n=1 Tax=Pyruvatibacter sp. TaxID=1981328 RepID=UPI0032ED105E
MALAVIRPCPPAFQGGAFIFTNTTTSRQGEQGTSARGALALAAALVLAALVLVAGFIAPAFAQAVPQGVPQDVSQAEQLLPPADNETEIADPEDADPKDAAAQSEPDAPAHVLNGDKQAVPVVVVDPAQPQVDLTSVVVTLRADREALLPDGTALVLSDDEVPFARVWKVIALQNNTDETQQRIVSIDRSAVWGAGIAPVRSGLSQLGAWRAASDASQDLAPQPIVNSARARAGEMRYLLTLPPDTTASFAIPFGSAAETPVQMWRADTLAAADAGRAAFSGLVIGALAIAFAFFAAQWAGQATSLTRAGTSAGSGVGSGAGSGALRLAALLTSAALAYELSAQGFFAAAFGWSAAWDARLGGVLLALATAAAAHVLAAERIRALSPDRERLARLAGWVALAAGLLVLVAPSVGLPFARLVAFAVALGGLAALTAGRGGDDDAQVPTPAAGELRAGWALLAITALLAALSSQGFMPRSPAVDMILHALAILGVLVVAYALAGPVAVSVARTAARRSLALGRGATGIAPAREQHLPDETAIRAEQRNALALAGASEAVWDLDVASGTLYVDPSLEAHLGLVPGSLCGRLETWMARVDRDDRRMVSQVLDENVALGNATFSLDMRLAHADPAQGSRWLELKATCFAGDDGSARRCVGTVGDITQRREEQAGLVRETLHDPLTGLANRPLFTDRLNRACRRARGTHERIALVLADLDRFKTVNESLGHAAADTVLAALAQRLSALIAPEDTLARIDGDTFALLIAGWSDDTGPADIAELVREAIAQPLEVSGREIFPTVSVGFTLREPHHESGEALLGEADIALRLAKRQGDTVQQYHPDMRPAADELATESGLRRALERGEIHLAYQPIMELATGRLAGFEALIRWHHPTRGIISPDDFVPLAERTGMIVPLGSFVLDRAAEDLAVWQRDFPQTPPLFSSVNVSSRQLLDDLPGKVAAVLERCALAPGSLRLEVTESLVMDDPHHAERILSALRDTGVKLALDDFGTGYSSLSYLQQFPFDVVKIDKSFVQRIGDAAVSTPAGGDGAIVRSVLSLASELELDVVAEGIEDDAARAQLQALGCTYGQGYLFGQPMEASAAHDFIARAID